MAQAIPVKSEYLRRLRHGRMWTQKQLAKEAGLTQNTISKLEIGARSGANVQTLIKLGHALDVEPSQLVAD